MKLPLGEPHFASGLSQAKSLASVFSFHKKQHPNVQFSSTFTQQFNTVVLRGQIISLSSS